MLAEERRRMIMQLARSEGAVRVADLVGLLRVSDVTVRRDLDALAGEGRLHKVHGGAVLPSGAAVGGPAHPQAPAVPEARPLTVGMLVPRSSYYFKRVVEGVRSTLPPERGRLLLAVSEYQPRKEEELVRGLLEAGAEALLLAPSAAEGRLDPDASWARAFPVPTVFVERRITAPEVSGASWVRTAHESGAAAAVRHLQALGHRRIALFSRGDTSTALSVCRGWEQALLDLGLDTDVPRILGRDVPGWPGWTRSEVRSLVRGLLAAGVTALVCHSDEDALELLRNGLAAEAAVPDQLSIVAYDDEFAEFASPALTAVSPPKLQVGALAAATLLDLVADPAQPARHIDLEPTLTLRESTAPLRTLSRRF